MFLLCSCLFLVAWFPFILYLFPFFVCLFFECIFWFWFVVALFFKYVNPFLICACFGLKKKKSLDILTFLPHILWFWNPLFNIFMFVFWLFLVFIITFTIVFCFLFVCLFPFWSVYKPDQVITWSYLSDYFPIVISPILFFSYIFF